jgi:hypothetical protein
MKTININWGGKSHTCEMKRECDCACEVYIGRFKELEVVLYQDQTLDSWECELVSETTFSGVSRYGNSAQEAVDNLYEFLQEELMYLQNLVQPK